MTRLVCLDGLRGILATYVLLGHMAPFAVLPDRLQQAVSHGAAAVDLFFVLSGLVIVHSLAQADYRARSFLIGRAARIFPVFLVVFSVAVLIQPLPCGFESMPWLRPDDAAHRICASAWPRHSPTEVVAHLTMTHGLFPQAVLPNVWVSFLGAAWSLSTEWQFYLLALVVRDRGRLTWLLLLLATFGSAWRLAGPAQWQFSRAFLPNQAHYFALGVASVDITGWKQTPGDNRARWRHFAIVLIAVLTVCAAQGAVGKLLPPLAWLLCLGVIRLPRAAVLRDLNRLLHHPVSRYLGAISYCLYLINEPVQKLLGGLLAILADGDGVFFTSLWIPAAIGLPLAAASALHHGLEAPALRWGRHLRTPCPKMG